MEPTKPTLKRLFALSGNRCAFPKCPTELVQGASVIAHVCHIKGKRPDAPRYDANQNETERHDFANLVLMCPTHHTVIDSDEVSYTVDRLKQIKAEHESNATPVDDALAESAATILISQTVNSTSQSGGITAHTVNVQIAAAPAPQDNPRRREAIETLWRGMLALGKDFADLWMAESILVVDEIKKFFEEDTWGTLKTLSAIEAYRYEDAVVMKMTRSGIMDVDSLQLHVPDDVWQVFFVYRGLYGRLGVLYEFSFRKRQYQDWRQDTLFKQLACLVVGEEHFNHFSGIPLHGLQAVLSQVQGEFRRRAAPHLS